MSVDYLHGVETVEVDNGTTTIETVKTAIIALIGIAPEGPVNALTLCSSASDDAQFGVTSTGFTIPKTLGLIRSMVSSAVVLVVNVFNPSTHTTAVTDELKTVADGAFKLDNAPVGDVTFKDSDGEDLAIVEGTDYELDGYGNFTALSSTLIDGTVVKVSYKKINTDAITDALIIGGTDSSDVRTGLDLFDTAYNVYGFTPKILVAPYYIEHSAVIAAIRTKAEKYRAIYLQDAPSGTTYAQAMASRGTAGTINFNTSSRRAYLLFPYLKSYDAYTEDDQIFPYSAFMAALIAWNDVENGFWESPSNKEITIATGSERVITWSLNDASTQANNLNSQGIATVAYGYGTGYLGWGNRNASYPSESGAKTFLIYQRIDDIVSESMELAARPYVDKGITQALIDQIRAAGNTYMKTLIGRGALLSGSKVIYSSDDNSESDLADGKIVFERVYMYPTPAERITFKSILDTSLLTFK